MDAPCETQPAILRNHVGGFTEDRREFFREHPRVPSQTEPRTHIIHVKTHGRKVFEAYILRGIPLVSIYSHILLPELHFVHTISTKAGGEVSLEKILH